MKWMAGSTLWCLQPVQPAVAAAPYQPPHRVRLPRWAGSLTRFRRNSMKELTIERVPAVETGAGVTIALCFAVAVLEGLDIQAMGVAAPRLAAELQLPGGVLGQALSSSNIGLVVGATLGGWLADKIGRKPLLIASVLLFGVFTLGTMVAFNYESLFALRVGAGLGFGGALTNLMAMAAEVSPQNKRGSTGAMMFC